MDDFIYSYYKTNMMNDKNNPYTFANKTLAKEIYEKLKSEHIDASIYDCVGFVYICITNKARRRLLKSMRSVIEASEAEISLYRSAFSAIQRDLNTER